MKSEKTNEEYVKTVTNFAYAIDELQNEFLKIIENSNLKNNREFVFIHLKIVNQSIQLLHNYIKLLK